MASWHARYADSNGCSLEANSTYDNAWRYRDYVIAAFNEDRPFDRFVLEQVAGDLLPAVSDQQRCRQLIATGFLVLGPKAFCTGSFEQFRQHEERSRSGLARGKRVPVLRT